MTYKPESVLFLPQPSRRRFAGYHDDEISNCNLLCILRRPFKKHLFPKIFISVEAKNKLLASVLKGMTIYRTLLYAETAGKDDTNCGNNKCPSEKQKLGKRKVQAIIMKMTSKTSKSDLLKWFPPCTYALLFAMYCSVYWICGLTINTVIYSDPEKRSTPLLARQSL